MAYEGESILGDAGVPPASPLTGRRRRRRAASSVGSAIGRALTVCAIVVILSFVLVRVIPGDPVTATGGARATPAAREKLREELGINGSLPTQFVNYVGDLAQGDLGASVVQQGRSVTAIIGETLPVTLAVILATLILSVIIGVPLGLLAAQRGGAADISVRSGMMVLLATPPFFLGLILLLVFAIDLGWLPAGGWGHSPTEDLRFLVLPAVALSGFMVPLVVRTTRQGAVEAANEPWAEALMTRGLSPRRIAWSHIFPNTLLPIITLIGFNAGALLTGAVVVEAVFALPGIGQQLVNAVNLRDYPVIQGIALVTAVFVVLCNLVADLLYGYADPRTRVR